MRWTAIRRRDLVCAAMLALILAAQALSLLAPLDRFLADKRFGFSDRPVSGEIAFVAIDKKSLDAVGVWPWPRSIHADITDRLRSLGARDIVFDIDFSTPSTPENDAAFAGAIERAGGIVTLPVFLQHADAASQDGSALITAPIPELAEFAWLASVNVFPDTDGKVRRFPTGLQLGEDHIASIPASIAGGAAGDDPVITIDFGIDAGGFDTVSAIDLMNGDIDPARIKGRTVVIGAFATELRDFYAVPKSDFIAGAVLQGVAAETLLAGRNLTSLDPMAIAVPVFLLLLALQFGLPRMTPVQTVLTYAAIPLIAEPAAIGSYLFQGLMVPTAFVHVSALTALGVRSLAMTAFFRKLSKEATTDAGNIRQVLQHVVRENFDAIIVTGEDGRALQVSEAVRDVFGLDDLPGTGAAMADFLPPELCRAIDRAIERARDGDSHRAETRTLTLPMAGDGSLRTIEYTIGISELRKATESRRKANSARRGPIVACLTARDISERLSYEEKLRWLSDRDDLTGIWRRHAFLRVIDEETADPAKGGFAIAAFNLHRFKTINVTLGRNTGNAVLRSFAERLQAAGGEVLGTARLGGDTFAVLLGGIENEAAACVAAEKIADAVGAPYPVDRGKARIGVQGGVALCDVGHGEPVSADILLDRAEMALDKARMAGGSRIVAFDEALAAQRMRSRIIERDLWHALDRGQIHVAYQLQVGLSDTAPHGAEALARWTHPHLGNVPPDEFISVAEANGFIGELGRWILFTACREAASWPVAIPVSVNVAPQQIVSDAFLGHVRAALEETGLAPERLTIELIESEMLESDAGLLDRIKALKALGVSISLDDFGTGYSGIGYLSWLRFDEIKIDKQFIKNLTTSAEAQGIVRSVAVLGDAFDLTIVCEGVETYEQEAFLRLIGCDVGQGYFYSRPVDADTFRALLEKKYGHAAIAVPA